MQIHRKTTSTIVELSPSETELLKHALERALFIDTPQSKQEEIAVFSSHLLQELSARITQNLTP